MQFRRIKQALCLGLLLIFWLLPGQSFAFDTAQDDQLLLLVNGSHTLAASWQPPDLLDIARLAPSSKGVMQLRDAAANAYVRMYTAYREEHSRSLNAVSGYRDYNYQKQLFNSKLAGRQRAGQSYAKAYSSTLLYTALPGTSEHQTGLAVDVSAGNTLSENFRSTEQGQWLLANCWDFGFILRYDENKTDLTAIAYEPWHYRYVGLPHSLIIRDRGWVLEEYMNCLQNMPPEEFLEYQDPANEDMLYRVYYTTDTAREFEDVCNISSDNCGGYIITTHTHRVEELLTNWSEMALHTPLLNLS